MHSLESRAGWLFPWESRWRAGAWGVHQSLNRCEVLLKYIPNTSEPEVRSSQVSREAGRNCMTYTAPTPESRQRTLWSENHRRLAWLIDWLIVNPSLTVSHLLQKTLEITITDRAQWHCNALMVSPPSSVGIAVHFYNAVIKINNECLYPPQ